jgi:hypothetical protein
MPRRFKQEAFQYDPARQGDRRTAVIPLVGWRNLGRPFYGFTIPGTLYGHRLNRVDDDI